MKKLLSTLCIMTLALICLLALPTRAEAAILEHGTCGDNLTWVLDDTGTLTISGNGDMYDYYDYEDDYPDEHTPWRAFKEDILSVVVRNNVTSIGSWAFSLCPNLTSVTLGSGVTRIGESAFYCSSNLSSVNIPDGVTKVGEWAFGVCSKLPALDLPDTVEIIGTGAFYGCSSLATVNIPDSVTKIGAEAFFGCYTLSSVTIPSGVQAIYESTFCLCEALTEIVIPDSVAYIGEAAFSRSGLTRVTMGSGIQEIGNGAFYNCTMLSDLYIKDIYVWWKANLADEYGDPAFLGATPHILDEQGNIITQITLDSSVSAIPDKGFYMHTDLTHVIIPDSVQSIGSEAFLGCENLQAVTLGNNLKTIGDFAFTNCEALERLVIPDSVQTLGTYAFGGCRNLKHAVFGKGLTYIAPEAFSSCISLNDVYIQDPNAWAKIVFDGESASPMLYIMQLHILDEQGKDVTEITLDSSVTAIPDSAFSRCNSLERITIGDNVQSIGKYAFLECENLQEVVIGNKVASVGEDAFYNCKKLTDVTFGHAVSSIGLRAFGDCENLQNFTFPNTLQTIGRDAFYNCDGLTSLTLPGSVTTIGNYAFHSCENLAELFISHGMTTVGEHAFAYCPNLRELTLPTSVTTICNYAFSNAGLKNVYYAGTQEQWDAVSIGSYNIRLTDSAIIHYNHIHSYSPCELAPTCEEDGYTGYTCLLGETRICTVLPALGHDMVYYEATTPNCAESGYSAGTRCSRCNLLGTATVLPPQHTFEGNDGNVCDSCGKTLLNVILPGGIPYVPSDMEDAVSTHLENPGSYILVRENGATIDIPEGVTVTVDLNGHAVTVTGSGTLQGMDSTATVSSAGGGYAVVSSSVTVVTDHSYGDLELRYIALEDSGRFTFHRLEMRIFGAVLRPAVCGMYFTTTFNCDPVLAAAIDTYGAAFSLENTPGADMVEDTTNVYTVETPDEDFGQNTQCNSALVKNIMKVDTVSDNAWRGNTYIYVNAYVCIDGTYIMEDRHNSGLGLGDSGFTSRGNSLFELMCELDVNWETLESDTKTQVRDFYHNWKDLGMSSWANHFTNIAAE